MRKLAAALAACLALVGCSALRVAYDNGDTLLHWRLTRYLDVEGAQEEALNEAIDDFLAWHRSHELRKYAAIANDAAQRLERGLSREDLVWGYDSLVTQARESLREAATRIAPLLDRLSEQQIQHIERRFAEDNRKFAREYLRGSERERRARRLKRNVERMEDWVGRLSKEQLERVRLYTARAPLFDEHRDRDRKRLQAELLSIIRAHEAGRRLPDAAAHWDRGRDPEYRAASAALFSEYYDMVLDLDRMLSPEQRARAAARMRGFARDFTALAGEPGRRQARAKRPVSDLQ